MAEIINLNDYRRKREIEKRIKRDNARALTGPDRKSLPPAETGKRKPKSKISGGEETPSKS